MIQNDIWMFPKIAGFPPKWIKFIMENPMNKWMIWGVKLPLFLVQHPCHVISHDTCKPVKKSFKSIWMPVGKVVLVW